MHLRRPKRVFGTEINITPLIDIVFLLIIFSMVVSQFTKLEVEKVDLAESKQGNPPPELTAGRLIISVHKDGKTVVAGKLYTPEALGTLIAELTKDRTDVLPVVLRGDRRAPWRHVASVLKVIAEQKIEKLKFAVLEKEAAAGS